MTEAKKVNYNSTNRAKYYEPQKEKSYTEKKIVTYKGNPNVEKRQNLRMVRSSIVKMMM